MAKRRLVVVGNGMVGHRFLELLLDSGRAGDWSITTFGEEPRPAYDRVNLTSFLGGKTAERPFPGRARPLRGRRHRRSTSATGSRRIDRASKQVTLASGQKRSVRRAGPRHRLVRRSCRRSPGGGAGLLRLPHHRGSRGDPRLRADAPKVGVVIGGGLLGLEAANALTKLGLETHVVEFAPRLMAMQVDDVGGAILRRRDRGARRRGAHRASRRRGSSPARTAAVPSAALRRRRRAGDATWSSSPPASARATSWRATPGLAIGERGGIVIDDRCRTSDPGRSSPSASARCTATHLRPGGARLPDGRRRGRRRWPATAASTLHRLRHEHQAQAHGRRRRQLRRRLRAPTPARHVISLHRHASPASTRSWSSARTSKRLLGRRAGRRRRRLRPAARSWRRAASPCRRTPEDLILPPREGEGRRPRRRRAPRHGAPSAPATTSPRAPSAAPSATRS